MFHAAPESMLLFALMERGEVAMIPADHHPASNNIALIGRSSRPVGVAYDPIEQVRTQCELKLYYKHIEMTAAHVFHSAMVNLQLMGLHYEAAHILT